jgi:plastocyanin
VATFNTSTRFMPGQSVCFKFDKAGTYPYHCAVSVVGVVRVNNP